MKIKLFFVSIFVLSATLLAFAIYGSSDIEYVGSVTVVRDGATLNIDDIESLESGDTVKTKDESFIKIKGDDVYYYVPENSSVLVRDKISIVSGVLYKAVKPFKSLDDFIEYDETFNLYADPYPLSTGSFASIYIAHEGELDIVKSTLNEPNWPITEFYEIDSKNKKLNVYRSVGAMHISWQRKTIPLKISMNTSEDIAIDVAIALECATTPLPERPKKISGVNKKMVTILGDKEKSQAERALLHGTIYTNFSETNYVTSPYIIPTTGRETSLYGAFRGYTSKYARFHEGYDLANVTGTPIYAANNGMVRISRELFVRGNCVVIDHGHGIYSSYFHMSELIAKEGTYVKKGDLIGLIGTTGMSTGPHLHWEMRAGNITFNPLTVLDKTLAFNKKDLVEIR